jgi:sugar-specific transcriptional regulator TrmB
LIFYILFGTIGKIEFLLYIVTSQLQKVTAELAKLGFSERETHLYLKLRMLGKSSVQEVAKAMEWNRTTTNVLTGLMQKGLVGRTILNGKKLFIAESEMKIKAIIEEKKWNIQALRKFVPEFQEMLDTFCPIQSAKQRNEVPVEYFEGREEVTKVYDRILDQWEGNMYSYCDIARVFKFFPENAKKFKKSAVKTRGKMWEILVDSKEARECIRGAKYQKKDYECCFISPRYNISTDCLQFGSTVAMITLEEKPTAAIITNTRIAETYRNIFFLAWEFFTQRRLYE